MFVWREDTLWPPHPPEPPHCCSAGYHTAGGPNVQVHQRGNGAAGSRTTTSFHCCCLICDLLLWLFSRPHVHITSLQLCAYSKSAPLEGWAGSLGLNVHTTTVKFSQEGDVQRWHNHLYTHQLHHSKSIRYLGITHLYQLKSIKYDPLISQIKFDIGRWNLIPFTSLASRIEVIKINVLPRLLYLFQTLPAEGTKIS